MGTITPLQPHKQRERQESCQSSRVRVDFTPGAPNTPPAAQPRGPLPSGSLRSEMALCLEPAPQPPAGSEHAPGHSVKTQPGAPDAQEAAKSIASDSLLPCSRPCSSNEQPSREGVHTPAQQNRKLGAGCQVLSQAVCSSPLRQAAQIPPSRQQATGARHVGVEGALPTPGQQHPPWRPGRAGLSRTAPHNTQQLHL